jgi:hypothetical protein
MSRESDRTAQDRARLGRRPPNSRVVCPARRCRRIISRPTGDDYVSRDAFEGRFAWGHGVALHAGAGSLYEPVVPVVLPRRKRHAEIVNDHQLELARALSRLGKALCCESEAEVPSTLRRAPVRSSAKRAGRNALTEGVRAALLEPRSFERALPIGSLVDGVATRLVHRVKGGLTIPSGRH